MQLSESTMLKRHTNLLRNVFLRYVYLSFIYAIIRNSKQVSAFSSKNLLVSRLLNFKISKEFRRLLYVEITDVM